MKIDNVAIINSLRKNFALDPQNSKVLVVGLGNTGLSVAHYLQKLGINFAITDSRDNRR
jgi:UDP-N-acetylmuramoylalanine--D-glutamate ligase